jgi:hypothetical protein
MTAEQIPLQEELQFHSREIRALDGRRGNDYESWKCDNLGIAGSSGRGIWVSSVSSLNGKVINPECTNLRAPRAYYLAGPLVHEILYPN